MATINTLSISGIPAIYPADYVGKLYFENRIQKYPESKYKIIETKDQFSTVDNPNYKGTQFIQNNFYPKYKATLYINENIDVDKVRFANDVVFTMSDGKVINAKIIDIKNNPLADTSIFRCEIDFFEKTLNESSIVNYLTYPNCLPNGWDVSQLHQLVLTNNQNIDALVDFAGGASVTFYTKLNPVFSRSELEVKADKNQGTDYIYRSMDFATVNATFYLTEAEMIQLKTYLPRCFYNDSGTIKGTKFIDASSGLEYTAVEAIIPKIQENTDFIDIYEFRMILKYSLTDFNHFV